MWDGNLDNMSLHDAEVIYDNDTSGEIGYWTGTQSNGTIREIIVMIGLATLILIMEHGVHFYQKILNG